MEVEINESLTTKAQYDYQLVLRATQNNDQKAYAELMQRYRDSVYFMLFKMIKNKEDAEDLTIEAFGKAFKRLGQYTPNFAFSTWLFKIASNNCIDFIRKKRLQAAYSLDAPADSEEGDFFIDVKSDSLNPEQTAIKNQKIKLMRQYVETLKPRYRNLIELRYFDEFSYEEISLKLGLPIGTVKAQLFRAREFLMKKMEHNIATI
jgi:RNA polymerase sigma-70 factor (ECF subfamily)